MLTSAMQSCNSDAELHIDAAADSDANAHRDPAVAKIAADSGSDSGCERDVASGA